APIEGRSDCSPILAARVPRRLATGGVNLGSPGDANGGNPSVNIRDIRGDRGGRGRIADDGPIPPPSICDNRRHLRIITRPSSAEDSAAHGESADGGDGRRWDARKGLCASSRDFTAED